MRTLLSVVVVLALLQACVALKCFDCVNDCSRTVECPGSCMKTVASAGYSEGVVRACSHVEADDGCRYQSVAGTKAEVCFCNNHLCNGAGLSLVSVPLLALSYLAQRLF